MRAASPLRVQRLGAPLPDDPGIIGTLIFATQLRDFRQSALKDTRIPGDLIALCEHQTDQRLLVLGLNGEDVAADAFCLGRLLERSIMFSLCQSACNTLVRQSFQREHGASWIFTEYGTASSTGRRKRPLPVPSTG